MAKAFVKNWPTFQHYKDRKPPWIKLHHSLLDDYAFACLPIASKALAPCIWLLASESADGSFDANPDVLSFRTHISVLDVRKGLKPLCDAGFIIMEKPYASIAIADCKQVAIPETETETETETEAETEKATGHRADDPGAFESKFWPAYPRKVAKASAAKAFAKIKPDDALLGRMLAALERERRSDQWQREDGRFIPHAATWLNQRRWEDEAQPANDFDPASFADGAVL